MLRWGIERAIQTLGDSDRRFLSYLNAIAIMTNILENFDYNPY